jgi:hypothetical protein
MPKACGQQSAAAGRCTIGYSLLRFVEGLDVNQPLRRLYLLCRDARGLWRELLMMAACIGIGAIVMPCLIFAVGRLALGPYAHGSVFALWRDFMIGLVSGSQAVWFIVLGPYLLIWLLRGGRWLLRRPPAVT